MFAIIVYFCSNCNGTNVLIHQRKGNPTSGTSSKRRNIREPTAKQDGMLQSLFIIHPDLTFQRRYVQLGKEEPNYLFHSYDKVTGSIINVCNWIVGIWFPRTKLWNFRDVHLLSIQKRTNVEGHLTTLEEIDQAKGKMQEHKWQGQRTLTLIYSFALQSQQKVPVR